MPYSIGSDRLERTDLSKIKSRLAEDEERRLTTDMRELYDRLKPTSAVEEKRGKLVNKLQDLLNNTWPGHDIQVHLFGSSGNLLCSDDSDGEPKKHVVALATKALTESIHQWIFASRRRGKNSRVSVYWQTSWPSVSSDVPRPHTSPPLT